jgi:hypothetical protein
MPPFSGLVRPKVRSHQHSIEMVLWGVFSHVQCVLACWKRMLLQVLRHVPAKKCRKLRKGCHVFMPAGACADIDRFYLSDAGVMVTLDAKHWGAGCTSTASYTHTL